MRHGIVNLTLPEKMDEDDALEFLLATHQRMRAAAEAAFEEAVKNNFTKPNPEQMEKDTDHLARQYSVADYWLANGKRAWNV